MLDIKFIRENAEKVKQGALDKKVNFDVDEFLNLDKQVQSLKLEVQSLQEQRNKAAKERNIEEGKRIGSELDNKIKELSPLEDQWKEKMLQIPNIAKDDVKVGKNEDENEVIRTVGEPTKFDFAPKDHLDLGVSLDIIDVERASKVSGPRFYYLKNEGALLEFALREYAFEVLISEGFIPVIPPVLIKKDVMKGLGYMENGGDEDMYVFDKDDLALVGTSEQSLVPMHMDEVLDGSKLPLRYVGFSTCFRREAGSYGKDTKGILRAHQFDKVEMVSLVKDGEDDREHDYLLSLEEKFLQGIGIPYQVIKMCTGDLGFPASRKYDLEGWIPSQEKYRELTSTSTTTDFQSRRLNIRYKDQAGNKFVQILNGTAFSTRPIIAILENFQQGDGSVLIPEVLKKYTKFEKISPKK